jgi:hypothetical protein
MDYMPLSARPALRRLAQRLAIGLFLDVWPRWAVASLLVSGLIAIACRMFFPGAAGILPWLWFTPLLTALPVFIASSMRAYRPGEVVALADWLGGGQGMLLTLLENDDPAWVESPAFAAASKFPLPLLRPWRKLAPLVPALAFLMAALLLPQRMPPQGNGVLADDIAADLTATLTELKQQELITPAEEKALEEEVERIRRDAQERVDASSWEAADALREKVAASLSEKQDAVKWAEESLGRYGAAAQTGVNPGSNSEAQSAELLNALEKLAKSGLLAGAPELQQLLKSGKLPADAKSLGQLTAALAKHLAETKGRIGDVARLGKESGRFNPSEFPVAGDRSGPDGGNPGTGGVNRGRADAPLTWGKESSPFDRFKESALPPGGARNPDEWAPIAVLPGVPQESAQLSARSAARQYAASAGQAAWRRTLAPRHQRAVKKYFEK